MRANVRAFVEIAARAFELAGPVYEFGSYLVEGQHGLGDLREFFPGQRYVGCDMRDGPGVDQIEDLGGLSLPDGSARTIVCVDTLEHVFEARRAVEEMTRVLAPGGMLLVSAPMDFRVHDYPDDYWRITPACMARLLAPLPATIVGSQGVENFPHTVFGIGCKTPASGRFQRGAKRFLHDFPAWLEAQETAIPWSRRAKRLLARVFRSQGDRRRTEEFFSSRFAVHHAATNARTPLCEASLVPAPLGSRIDLQ